MKVMIVYYSLEGNTELIAKTIEEECNGKLVKLELEKEFPKKGFMKFVWGGKQVVLNEKPSLKPYNIEIDKYDLIILGTPVWAGSYAPAFRTFFEKTKIQNKKIAFFACYSGGEGKAFEGFKSKLAGNEFIGEIGFKDPAKKNREENIKKAKEWIEGLIR